MEFVIDMSGRLWRGPSHWELLEGKRADGSPIWDLCAATKPIRSSPISAADASQLIERMPGEADPR